MNLIEFLDGHDKAMSAMNNVIDMVEYVNLNEGDGVISVTEVVEELATVKRYIKELETLFLTSKGE
ncbi:MAG: hypothetical protein SPD91_06560 [Streptococcus hyointestinalis]|uniref:hypothetical protein n=1 Tax=Streptococcus hyointestinalis TaxID=1337 RepID=UPI0023F0E110|nr:hypothetical protein [Streptococcus hyointestinalis]MCI6872485.1 hypothetical protein [Streptococcus hyointestinalis]MDD7356358.1 hypothetical protein [Streptococcus hyointestinalis]MDY4554112.1 hypothetical protein [Streptococcus hyointestinalis]